MPWMFQALAAMLGLERLALGPQGREAAVTGLWTLELESDVQPAIAVGVVHQGERSRAAIAVMPHDPFLPLSSRCMPADDVVRAAEKQLRYVPLLGGPPRCDASAPGIRYRVQCWAHDTHSSVSFRSQSRGPLRTLATTLHQLVDHVARQTGARDELGLCAGSLLYEDELAAE